MTEKTPAMTETSKADAEFVSQEVISGLGLPFELRPYQVRGAGFLALRDHALLADDMGLGKTVQCIVALAALKAKKEWSRTLVIVPKSLRKNWKTEFDKWAPQLGARLIEGNQKNRTAQYLLPFPLLIASYDQIRLDIDHFVNTEVFDIVILDEAQTIKNRSSKVGLACTMVPRAMSWALTGTPLENSPRDLGGIFSFVNQGLLLGDLPVYEVHERIEPYFLRRTAEEALPELPEKIEQTVELELSGEQASLYDEALGEREEASEDGELLALITKLKQICNQIPSAESSAKLDALSLVLQTASETKRKTLVFSQYVKTLEWIQERLKGHKSDIYHGDLSEDERDAVLDRFRSSEGIDVLLMSLKAGSVGLNLQEADLVVLYDRWWNPAVEEQAIRRAYRFGRTRPLHVLKFKTADTIEERIEVILDRKRDLFDQYVEGIESEEGPGLDELRWILGLKSDYKHVDS